MTSTSTANLSTCQWCGCIHGGKCPQVKAIEYNRDGSVKRVEFFGPGDYTVPIQMGGAWWGVTPPTITWKTDSAGTNAIPISGISATLSNTEGANVTGSVVDANNPYVAGYTFTDWANSWQGE